MPTHLYLAPAGAGKTTFVLQQARAHALGWRPTRLVVGSSLQSMAAHRQLSRLGGGMGVRIQTVFGLARELLDRSGSGLTLINDPIQVRFLRLLVDEADLRYYAPLARMPGFIRALRGLFAELTADLISPSQFGRQVRRMGEPARLAELARLYAMYHRRLQAENWMDGVSLLLRAQEAISNHPGIITGEDFLGVDGFFTFRPAELALLKAVAEQAGTVIITLTGDLPAEMASAATFAETIAQVENAFDIVSQPLPSSVAQSPPSSLHYALIAAPDMAGEVRVALRWLKEQLALRDVQPGEAALLARDISPYRDVIRQTAAEFGLPVRISGGFPLRDNPAVDAFISLVDLCASATPERRFSFRATVRAWRSPYFDWRWPDESLVIESGDADALDRLGRWARVIAGAEQWHDAFQRRLRDLSPAEEALSEDLAQEAPSPRALAEAELQDLQQKWLRFQASMTPPEGKQPIRVFIRWLEDLMGPDPEMADDDAAQTVFSLDLVARIRQSKDDRLLQRDIAAVRALKEVMRGMVWAADALSLPAATFSDFFTDLVGALEAARYDPPFQPSRGQVQAVRVDEAAGLRFKAVALLGMAEGSFPAVLREDAFLRGGDRDALRKAGLMIDPSPHSREAALFYVAASRAETHLLATRPRLAPGGAQWQESPYWRLLVEASGVTPTARRHEDLLDDVPVASRPELALALAAYPQLPARAEMEAIAAEALPYWRHGHRVLRARLARRGDVYDGDLSGLAPVFTRRFGPDHVWSAARLESYRNCPYRFFATSVLHLEERPEPVLGLDHQQMGLIYHQALEEVFYRGAAVADDAAALIAIWEDLADALLAEAPAKYGFRPTAWWPQTQEQIKTVMRHTLQALAEENASWRPRAFEAAFGIDGKPKLTVAHDVRAGDALHLRGVIDRVDGDGQGGVRVVDYKRGAVSGYSKRSLQEGEHLQLPLYALAAEALGHGQPADGFYWSVTNAEASKLRLGAFGVDDAVTLALAHSWEAIDGARAGQFQPQPPRRGCPDFCPAAAFCWRYRPGW